MKKQILFFLCLLLVTNRIYSQVTIGSDQDPESFSILELISEGKGGMRLPQLTSWQRDRITDEAFKANPKAQGLMIFNFTNKRVEVWNGSQWLALSGNGGQEAEKAVWRILWAICPQIDATVDGVRYRTAMTEDEIEMVKRKAVWFEEFVEKYTNDKLDIQLTIDVIRNPITALNPGGSNNVYGFPLPMEDRFRLRPEENFDGQILTADYTGIPRNWMGITLGSIFTSWIAFDHSGYGVSYGGLEPEFAIKQLHTNVYVHEWLHQLEWYFSQFGSGYEMPVLHNNETEYKYITANTGLSGEYQLEKWYADYLRGTIVSYPGATGTCKGVNPDWWQYSPSYWKNTVITSPANYAEHVSESPVLTVKWENPVVQTYAPGSYHVVLRDGITDEELGFYRVTHCMSADKKTLTLDFGQALYKMWDNVYLVVPFERGKTYRLTSYSLEYSDLVTAPAYVDANFSILFTIEP